VGGEQQSGGDGIDHPENRFKKAKDIRLGSRIEKSGPLLLGGGKRIFRSEQKGHFVSP